MPDEDNPVIYIEYTDDAFPPVSWNSIKNYALRFNVKNSGILKVPEAQLVLKNTDGRYTGGGAITLGLYQLLRIRADVRGVIDTLFYGRIESLMSYNQKKRELLTVTARGFTQRLLQDTITYKYLTEQNEGVADRSMKDVIDHFLANPDSGVATGINLITDTGAITTEKAKHDFDRESLLDAVKTICEYVGYAGYEEVSDGNINLHLYPYGWEPTNPAITIPEDVINRRFEHSLEELYNHICVWSPPQVAYPDHDRFTENGVTKGYWTADNLDTTVEDSVDYVEVNSKSIKIYGYQGNYGFENEQSLSATLDLTSDFPNGIDFNEKEVLTIEFWIRGNIAMSIFDVGGRLILTDTDGNKIAYKWASKWSIEFYPVGVTHTEKWVKAIVGRVKNGKYYLPPIYDDLTFGEGFLWHDNPTKTFNWKVVKITFYICQGGELALTEWWIDGLHMTIAKPVNPIEDPDLAKKDTISIDSYGVRVLHYDEPSIRDYAVIPLLAEKILNTTKNPLKKLEVKYGAKTWVKPNQYVMVNMPLYGISNEEWRIVEVHFDWSTKTKLLRSTLYLTPRTQPVTSREWYGAQLEQIIKSLIW